VERAPWIIGGSIVLAAAIVAVALVTLNKKETPGVAEAVLIDARERAQDRAAQAHLRNALVAAKTYWTDNASYAGWGPGAGAAIEPSLVWGGDGPASEGAVSINLATGDQVVMSTVSASGQAFCVADDVGFGGTTYGRVDAAGASDAGACVGGW
jgi:hypothetical protein